MEFNYFWILIIIFVIARALLENLFNSEKNSPSPGPEEKREEDEVELNYSEEQTPQEEPQFAEDETDELAQELAEEKDFFQQSGVSEESRTEKADSSSQRKKNRVFQQEIGNRQQSAITGSSGSRDQEQPAGMIAGNEIKNIQQQGLKHSDLVRGIIMMEILDQPRAYRPHRPPHQQTKN